jgi:AcrR family transcriptional regulator
VTLKSKLIHLEQRFANDGAGRRDHIVLCAAELFTGFGYDATSTDALAKRAGVKPAALYREFESKDEILYTVLEYVFEGFLADMEEAVRGITDPCARLARITWAHTWIQLSSGSIARAPSMFSVGQLIVALSPERATRLRALARAHGEHIRSIVRDGQRENLFDVPDIRSAALAIATIAEFSPLWFREGGALNAEDVAEHNALYALRVAQATIDDPVAFVRRVVGADSASPQGAGSGAPIDGADRSGT